ncbi:MAG: hypothetical protein AAGI91_01210 [Bacteroidota bacterium]
MDHELEAPEIKGRRLSYGSSVWSGTHLFVDGERVKLKQGETEVVDANGTAHRVRMRTRLLDPSPTFTVNERTIETASPLAWYEYAWCALPGLLVFVGGLLGGAIGGGAAYLNVHLFRTEEAGARRYVLTGLVSAGAFMLFFALATALSSALGR